MEQEQRHGERARGEVSQAALEELAHHFEEERQAYINKVREAENNLQVYAHELTQVQEKDS